MNKISHVHNYPVDSKYDILDIKNENENFFVSTSSGVSYLGKLEDFNESIISKSTEFLNEVPKEDTNLYIEERLRIYYQGKCIWKNKDMVNFNKLGQDELTNLNISEFVKTAIDTSSMEFKVRVSSEKESTPIDQNYEYNTKKFHDAANEANIKSKNGYTLITRVVMNIDWH